MAINRRLLPGSVRAPRRGDESVNSESGAGRNPEGSGGGNPAERPSPFRAIAFPREPFRLMSHPPSRARAAYLSDACKEGGRHFGSGRRGLPENFSKGLPRFCKRYTALSCPSLSLLLRCRPGPRVTHHKCSIGTGRGHFPASGMFGMQLALHRVKCILENDLAGGL
jgi:hypothetical protein